MGRAAHSLLKQYALHMRLQRILPPLMLTVSLFVPQAASAHAIIVNSSPAIDAVLSGEDVPIRLRFNSRIDHARSKITLFAPDGAQQSLTPTPDSPADGLNAEAKALSPGGWRLRWQVLSVDGHITRGDIPFTVR
jgi:copper resistance protein C